MASSDKSVKQRLRHILATEAPPAITGAVWHDLLGRLAPVSESYLRDLLRETQLPFEQPYAGVRQHTLDELESSLKELCQVYTQATAEGDRDRARYCRKQVIAAKDRARFLAGNPRTAAQTRAEKQEMVAWLLIWLDDPGMFSVWVEARKRVLTSPA